MSVPARVFLQKNNRGLKFETVWIDEESEKAIKELGLEDKIPDGTIPIRFDGRYVKYTIGVHDVFIKMVEA